MMRKTKVSITGLVFAAATCLLAALMAIAICFPQSREVAGLESGDFQTVHAVGPEDEIGALQDATEESLSRFTVSVRRPAGPPRIELTGTDLQGRSASVACSTCHRVRPADKSNTSPETLDEFHQGMVFSHGKITCYACHNPDDADTLRMADGSSVEYQDVMRLCSQCHSPQATAFAHGAHGGMNGYWDLSRGPQTKNHCVDCHDPHSPRFPKMVVGFKPRDRFNDPPTHDPTAEEADEHDTH